MILGNLFGQRGAYYDVPGVNPSGNDGDLGFLFDIGDTNSGVTVTETSALSSSAVFAAVRILSGVFSQLPGSAFQETDGDREKHPANSRIQRLLHDEPNPDMTPATFQKMMIAHQLLFGNFYAQIVSDNIGPVALCPMDPLKVTPFRDKAKRSRPIAYKVQQEDGSPTVLPREEVFHVMGFTLSGYKGTGFVHFAREAIAMALVTEKHGAYHFKNFSRPPGYLWRPPGFDKKVYDALSPKAKDRVRKQFERDHGGENLHRIAILEEGMEFRQLGFTAEESQYLGTREFQVLEIARIFGVPPHLLMDMSRASFNSVEQESSEFVQYYLNNHIVAIEQEYNRKLFPRRRYLGVRDYVKFNVDALLRGSLKELSEALSQLGQNGFITRNEGRDKLDLNRHDEPGADALTVQVNLTKLDDLPRPNAAGTKPPSSSDNSEEDDQALVATLVEEEPPKQLGGATLETFRPMIEDVAARLSSREFLAISRQAPKRLADGSFAEWSAEFYLDFQQAAQQALLPLAQVLEDAVEISADDVTGAAEAWVARSNETLGAALEAESPLAEIETWISNHEKDSRSWLYSTIERGTKS